VAYNKIDKVLKVSFLSFLFQSSLTRFGQTKAKKIQQNPKGFYDILPPLIIPPLSCQATQNFKRFSK
jgi:hypothetical protein